MFQQLKVPLLLTNFINRYTNDTKIFESAQLYSISSLEKHTIKSTSNAVRDPKNEKKFPASRQKKTHNV
jgi:hypothetical protein